VALFCAGGLSAQILVPIMAGGSAPCGAYAHCAALTYDYTKNGTANSSGFPALVSWSHANMKLAADGYVQSATCADVLFFADAALTTQIPSEIEVCDTTNGIGTAWIYIGTLSYTASGTIHIAVGNAAPPARTSGVWASEYMGVYHLPNGTTLTSLDSLGANNANPGGTGNAAVAGVVDGGIAFNGSGNLLLNSNQNFPANFTISFWTQNPTNTSGTYFAGAIQTGSAGIVQVFIATSSRIQMQIRDDANSIINSYYVSAAPNLFDGGWHNITFVRAGSAIQGYLDGAAQSMTPAGSINANAITFSAARELAIGANNNRGTIGGYLTGNMDEFRIVGAALSSSWILAEHNNQKTPGNIGTPGYWTWGAWK